MALVAALSDGCTAEEDAEADEQQQDERYPEVHPTHQEALHVVELVLSTNVTNLRLDHHVILQAHLLSALGRQVQLGIVHILQQVTAVADLALGERKSIQFDGLKVKFNLNCSKNCTPNV